MNPYIDLNKCESGDILVSKSGVLLTYDKYVEHTPYPHKVKYMSSGLGDGSRNDDGSVFTTNKLDTDQDIVLIIPQEMFKGKLSKYLMRVNDEAVQELLFKETSLGR